MSEPQSSTIPNHDAASSGIDYGRAYEVIIAAYIRQHIRKSQVESAHREYGQGVQKENQNE